MKYYTLIFSLVLTFFFCTGCASDINNTRLKVSIDDIQRSELLKLINSNDDITLYKIGLKVMEESGFLNQNGQEYGYYAITIKSRHEAAPNRSIITFINAVTLFLPSLIGFPTDFQQYNLTGNLYIFDSKGAMIKVYVNSISFEKINGLFWGQDPDKKASRYYSILFKGILDQINLQKDEINYLLRTAGPVTNDNMQAARVKITDFFKLSKL